MNDTIQISDSRFFDPLRDSVDERRLAGLRARSGAKAGEVGRNPFREPSGAGESGSAGLEAAIRAYAYAYRIGAAHEIERAWAACMQQLDK